MNESTIYKYTCKTHIMHSKLKSQFFSKSTLQMNMKFCGGGLCKKTKEKWGH